MATSVGMNTIASTHSKIADSYVPDLPRGRQAAVANTPGDLPGQHLLVDFQGARKLDDVAHIEAAFTTAIAAAGATLLGMRFHVFSPGGGVTGTAELAESHISIHTWPESAYAALDIFMCGACDPLNALPALVTAFGPAMIELRQVMRGNFKDASVETPIA